MSLTAFIFARGGSKGLPGKNLRPMAGKPLIGWAIEQAAAASQICRVIVSTDCAEIAATARAYGAETPFMRPKELAADHSSEMLAWRHALQFLRDTEGSMPDPFVSVPTTAPLRLPQDITAGIDEYRRSGADVVITISPARANPWFSMVAAQAEGGFRLVNQRIGNRPVTRRQDAPEVFDIIPAVYVARASYVMSHESLFGGKVSANIVPPERAFDIDTLLDFEIAEFMMRKRLNHHRSN